MTREDRQLLLKDLCGRLPHGVKVLQNNGIESILDGCPSKKEYCFNLIWDSHKGYWNQCQAVITEFKPYLRSMSSMTEEERRELSELTTFTIWTPKVYEWYIKHHFDIHNLIEKGLALVAPEGMYKIE